MLKTIIGVLILIFPFLFITKFKDKKIGFAYILSFLIGFHLFVAIITQAFKIFTYPVVLGINLIILIIIILKFDLLKDLKKIKLIKLDWVLIIILAISFIHLYQVHYNYSGKYTIATIPQYQEAENMRYPYPYFADEWYAVAFAKYSIVSQRLPLVNPLMENHAFINLEFPFHSFVAGQLLLLDLDPLTDYTKLTIFSGMLVCVLIYIFLRVNKLNKYVSGIASLSTLYITNGANLPGIWTLIPLIMGIISLLLFIIFLILNKKSMIFFSLALTLLFYPPLVIFCFLALLSKKFFKVKEFSYYTGLTVLVAIILSITYFMMKYPLIGVIKDIWFSRIFYPTFTQGFIPRFLFFKIVPALVSILALVGLVLLVKKKLWLANLLFLGLAYLILYSFVMFRFIIEYERVVVLSSVFIVIFSGFGLHFIIKFLQSISVFKKKNILNYVLMAILLLFILFSFNYTKRENWEGLTLVNPETKKTYLPAAPANNYLHPDDINLFQGINKKIFLSLPWKGTTVGVATDNYAVVTKEGTISNNPGVFILFMNADCNGKSEIIEKYNIDYVYTAKIDCSGLELVGKSGEGLHLYKVLN